MHNKVEDLINLIYLKLKKNKAGKINLEKNEFTDFINFLINNN